MPRLLAVSATVLLSAFFSAMRLIGGIDCASPVTVRTAMDPKFQLLLTLRIFVLVAAIGALLVALQMSGLSRDVGIWIWAAGAVILSGLILGPPLAEKMSGRRALVFGAILLGLGAAIYLYMVYVVIPDAIERANANDNKHQSTRPR